MTKEQFKEMLTEKIGGTPFAEEVIEDLTINFETRKTVWTSVKVR